MEMNIDKKELVELCEEFISVPSPVSYYEEVGALLEKKAAEFGYEVTYDRKRTAYSMFGCSLRYNWFSCSSY